MVTLKPRAWSNLPREAEMMPFPSEEVTPPVTKMYLAADMKKSLRGANVVIICYRAESRDLLNRQNLVFFQKRRHAKYGGNSF